MDSEEAEAIPPPPPSSPPAPSSATVEERAGSAETDLPQATAVYQQPPYEWQAYTDQHYMPTNGAEYGLTYDAYGQPEQASAPLPPAKRQKTGKLLAPVSCPLEKLMTLYAFCLQLSDEVSKLSGLHR